MRAVNRTRQTVLVERGAVAATPWARLVGLLGRRVFERGDGLLFRGEQSIHTLGMAFPIDVVYLDAHAQVVRAIRALPPQRFGPLVRGVKDVLELPMGTLAATGTREGDQISFDLP